MSPLLPCADSRGRGTSAFLRLWGSKTTIPLRGDTVLWAKDGTATEDLQSAWRGAFGRTLTDEPLLLKGLPTRAFVSETRAVNL